MKVKLQYSTEVPCVFAAQEWQRYARKVFTDISGIDMVSGCGAEKVTAAGQEGAADLTVKLASREAEWAFLERCAQGNRAKPEADRKDVIGIRVEKGRGVILGSTPGAVLIAVYRFFRECGCRFTEPGAEGEYLVQRRLEETDVEVCEAAAYDVRGIAIEGACSYENVLDMIDFCPKIGLNVYQFQFKESFVFFERWYDHLGHPEKEQHRMTPEQTGEMVRRLTEEVKKRGIRLYTMGHGWNTEPLGLPGIGWQEVELTLSEETRQLLAQVDGVRGLVGKCPLRTNLCYSNPAVQRKIVDYMTDYAAAHPEDDVILFSLSDSYNHCCECENCAGERASDWMIQLLNQVDERFTQAGLKQKIAFDAYYDTLWGPVHQKIRHPERFVLEFAPITRAYHEPYPVEGIAQEEPEPYVLNKLRIPQNTADNLAYLKAWQRAFPGRSYAAEYHFMWAHYADPGYQKIARVLQEDIRRLRQLNLEGMIMYQPQRCAMPTAMGLYVQGQALWNPALTFEEISGDYFSHAFGAEGAAVRAYLEQLSESFAMLLRPAGRTFTQQELLERLECCMAAVEAFDEKSVSDRMPVYQEYLKRLLACLLASVKGDREDSKALLKELTAWLWSIEDSVQSCWDIRELTERMGIYVEAL